LQHFKPLLATFVPPVQNGMAYFYRSTMQSLSFNDCQFNMQYEKKNIDKKYGRCFAIIMVLPDNGQ